MRILERCREVEKRFPLAPSGGFVSQKDGWTRYKQYSTPDHIRKNANMFWNFGVSREIRYEVNCRKDNRTAKILTFDREERKMSLGIKQLTQDPWTDITSKYPVGSKHKGIVRNFTNFGVFIELEEGIDGLVYISDLSWTKKVKHPSEILTVGDNIDVVVMELDVEGRKLSLGHKQTQDNHIENFIKSYQLN